jgi:heme/copper-type cytochrome/quinol oxidase subunit 4
MDLKPGFKTSEFWISLILVVIQTVFQLILLLYALANNEAEVWPAALMTSLSVVAVCATTGIYSYSRGMVKRAHALRQAAVKRPGPAVGSRHASGRR